MNTAKIAYVIGYMMNIVLIAGVTKKIIAPSLKLLARKSDNILRREVKKMGRLIDEKTALQRFIEEAEAGGKGCIHINTIKRILQDIDTAYDVEKVTDGIKDYFKDKIEKGKDVDGWDICDFSKDIIDIVRK